MLLLLLLMLLYAPMHPPLSLSLSCLIDITRGLGDPSLTSMEMGYTVEAGLLGHQRLFRYYYIFLQFLLSLFLLPTIERTIRCANKTTTSQGTF